MEERASHVAEAGHAHPGTPIDLTSHLNTHSRFSACFGGGLVTPEPRLRRNPALLPQMRSTPLDFSERRRGGMGCCVDVALVRSYEHGGDRCCHGKHNITPGGADAGLSPLSKLIKNLM